MQPRHTRVWTVLLIAAAACFSDRPGLLEPDHAISDGAHSGGTPGFFFLPPMVSQPAVTGIFDPDIVALNPVVLICDVTAAPDTDCGGATPALRVFTRTSSPAITVDDGKYKVNWDTREGDFSPGRTYRVHVRAGTPSRELGFADILLTTEPGKIKKLADGETIVLNDGRTLPIHFRIEQGLTVGPGPARVLALTGLPTSLASGTAASVTVTARDQHGNVATGYVGTVTFTSSNLSASLPADFTFTAADAGTHTFTNAVSFATAGSSTVRVADAADAGLFDEATLVVLPGSAVSLAVDGLTDPTVAGAAGSITVTLRDGHGNVATGYTGTVAFASNDPAATLPAPYTFTAADAGVRAFPVTLRTAGIRFVSVTDEAAAALTGSQIVAVTPAAAAELRFTTQPSGAGAGVAIAPPVIVTAYDPFGNVATGFVGLVTAAIGANPPGGVLSGTLQATAVAGVATFGDLRINAAGSGYTLVASAAGVADGVSEAFDIAAQHAILLDVSGLANPTTAGVAGAITVTARDAHGNVATGYAGTIAFISTDGAATLPAMYTFTTADAGTHVFPGVILRQAGARTVTAIDQSDPTIRGSQPVTVIAANATVFVLTDVSSPVIAGVAHEFTVTARDQFGNLAAGYVGTVAFTSTDPDASVPDPYEFQAADAGVRSFPGGVTFRTAGGQALRATDAATPTITGALTRSVLAAAASQLRFTVQPTDAIAGSPIAPPVVVTAYDAFNNVASGFTGNVTMGIGTNPSTGVLSGTLTVAAAAGVATFGNLIISAGGNGYTLAASATGLTGAISASFTISAAGPTEVHWINPAGGSWLVGSNWSTGTVPAPDEAAFIDLPGTYTVTLNAHVTVFDLVLGATSGTQTLAVNNPGSLSLTNAGTIRNTGQLNVTLATQLAGAGLVTNRGTLRLISGTVVAPLRNEALLVGTGFSAINGGLTNVAGSTLRVEGNSTQGTATLAVGTSFTNEGLIELTNTFSTHIASLNVNGTLTNAPGGTIQSLPGAGGGPRNLNVGLLNQGTLTVAQALTISRVSADHLNSGVIQLAGGNLTVEQSGTTPSFTNTGALTVPAGRTMSVSGGGFTLASGATLSGGGAMILTSVAPAAFGTTIDLTALSLVFTTASFAADVNNATLAITLSNSTVNGPGTLTNADEKTLTLISSTVNAPLVNFGLLINAGSSSINGGFTADTGSTLRVEGNGTHGTSSLTVGTSFTNRSLIELTNTFSTHIATLNVTGTLTNAAGATIRVRPGAGGGPRNLNAGLLNLGTVVLEHSLTINRVSADHSNQGLIDLPGGNLTVMQSGTTPSFTNSATINIPAGRTFTVSAGAFTQAAGATLGGGGGMSLNSAGADFHTAFDLSAMSLIFTTASFAADINTAILALTLDNSTVNGPGTITNADEKTLSLISSTVNTALVNFGTIVDGGTSTINGALTADTGSTLRVEGNGVQGTATLTVAAGFTNRGLIELTNTFSTHIATLNVNGTLTNAPGATIRSLPGAGGGPRNLNAGLLNQGTVTVTQALTINRVSADHLNSGVIDLAGGNLTVTQTGTTPSFTNTGTLTIQSGRTMSINTSGSFTQAAGATLNGGGAMSFISVNPAVFETAFTLSALSLISTTANFSTDITTATLALSLNGATVNGPGTLTNADEKTLTLINSAINAPLVNFGLIVDAGASTISGAFTADTGSTLRVEGNGIQGTATLTVAPSFTNRGVIELTNTFSTHIATLNVTGTLTNAVGATIRSLPGAGGGGRNLNAQLVNQGTLVVNQALGISRASADHANSGAVNVNTGSLTVTHSGTTPTFTNTGAITLPAGTAFVNTGGLGSFTNGAGGTIAGAGTFTTNAGTALANSGSVTAALVRVGGTLTGDAAGSFAPATTEFHLSATQIPVGPGLAYTNILVNTGSSIAFAGSYELPGNLTVAASSNLGIGAHEIVVQGNFVTQSVGVLTMQNALGVLSVRGSATFGGGSTNNRLTAGTLRVGGHFTQNTSVASFSASGSHLTVLNGTALQVVTFTNPGTTTVTSHFHRLEIANASAAGIILDFHAVATGQLRTPAGPVVTRRIVSTGFQATAGGLDAAGLVFDGTPLQVLDGDPMVRFDDITFRNMDPTIRQLSIRRLADVVTFNTMTFETVPTTGFYLELFDMDAGGTILTVTMAGTTPANHGGRVLLQQGAQLLGWPL